MKSFSRLLICIAPVVAFGAGTAQGTEFTPIHATGLLAYTPVCARTSDTESGQNTDAATKMHHLVLVTVGLAAFLGLLSTLSLAKGARDVPPSWVSWGGQSEWEIAFCGMTQRWLIAGFVGLAATLVMSVVSLFVGYYAL